MVQGLSFLNFKTRKCAGSAPRAFLLNTMESLQSRENKTPYHEHAWLRGDPGSWKRVRRGRDKPKEDARVTSLREDLLWSLGALWSCIRRMSEFTHEALGFFTKFHCLLVGRKYPGQQPACSSELCLSVPFLAYNAPITSEKGKKDSVLAPPHHGCLETRWDESTRLGTS